MPSTRIVEPGGLSLLHDLSAAAGELAAETGRHIHLVLENGDNRASILDADAGPAARKISRAVERRLSSRLARADDRRERRAITATTSVRRRRDIARSLSSGFVYQGEPSAFRGGKRGRAERPSGADRLHQLPAEPRPDRQPRAGRPARKLCADAQAIEAALAVLLLAPSIPMLFMGEEWGSKAPFPFFCDFKGDLADAVRKGRRSEYAWAYAQVRRRGARSRWRRRRVHSAVLDWNERDAAAARRRLTLVQELLAIRRREIVPRLAGATFGEAQAAADGLLTAHWRMGDGATLRLLANLSDRDIGHTSGVSKGTLIWGSELGDTRPAMVGALAHRIGQCPRRSRSRPIACNYQRISISTPPPPSCLI